MSFLLTVDVIESASEAFWRGGIVDRRVALVNVAQGKGPHSAGL